MSNLLDEEIYKEYIPLLWSIAASYNKSTGLDIQDLYSEAVVGLVLAKRDFDPSRSNNFKYFALRKIKDTLHNFIRRFSTIVVIPSYIKKASSLLNRLNVCLLSNGIPEKNINDLLYFGLDSTMYNEYSCCKDLFDKLNRAAERASISYQELVQRASTLPIDIEVNESCATHNIEDPLSIVDIRQLLDADELIVVEGVANGKTFKEIGKENNKSHSWAHNIMKRVRVKMVSWS